MRDGGSTPQRIINRGCNCGADKQVAQVRTLLRIMRRGAAVGDGTAKGALLGSEPGTGKTPMSITLANALGGQRPFRVLIIAGQNYRHVWVDHILKWQWPARRIIPVNAGDVHDLSVFTNCWCILNYEILDRFEESIRRKQWDLLIIDESHAAKNALAKRTVQIYGGKWERRRVDPIPAVKTLVVTGTPILNFPPELFTALRHLDPEQWSRRYKAFVNDWYDSDSLTTFTIDETLRVFGEPRDLDQLQRKLRNTVMVREYLEGLPPKIYEVKVIPPTAEDVDFFMRRKLALNLIRDQLRRTKKKSKRAAIRLRLNQTYENARKRTADRKYPHLRNDLLALPTNFKKLIFCLHDHIVQRFESDFRAAGRTFVTLTGKIGDARYVQEQFQNNPYIEFFIGNIRAGGVGIDLYAAHYVVFAELDWVPGLMEQAENRAHRRGQKEQVTVVRYFMEFSSDEWVWRALHNKTTIKGLALDPPARHSNPYPEMEMSPEAAKAFWEAYEKEWEKIFGGSFEDFFRDVGVDDEAEAIDEESFNVDELLGPEAAEAGTEDEPVSPKLRARFDKLTKGNKKWWCKNCPAVKNYTPHEMWTRDELGNLDFGTTEEGIFWKRIYIMRKKAEQSKKTAPEDSKTHWNFYRTGVGAAKTKYRYIHPDVIYEFPDLGLEKFD
jgi:hypothetical protein